MEVDQSIKPKEILEPEVAAPIEDMPEDEPKEADEVKSPEAPVIDEDPPQQELASPTPEPTGPVVEKETLKPIEPKAVEEDTSKAIMPPPQAPAPSVSTVTVSPTNIEQQPPTTISQAVPPQTAAPQGTMSPAGNIPSAANPMVPPTAPGQQPPHMPQQHPGYQGNDF